jgi:hypothetical protein
MARRGLKVSRAEFEQNLLKKFDDSAFREDIVPLLRDGIEYNFDAAASFILNEVVSMLPGSPWKRVQDG